MAATSPPSTSTRTASPPTSSTRPTAAPTSATSSPATASTSSAPSPSPAVSAAHLVRGVIEHTGSVESFTPAEHSVVARFRAPPEILRYVIVKGPIAVSGISLTVIAKDEATFSVGLVPFTQENTNLMGLRPGDRVNLESDIIARYVEQLLEERGHGDAVTPDSALKRGGLGDAQTG